eukprot:5214751-Alexandrium_andersonii.AAC.1
MPPTALQRMILPEIALDRTVQESAGLFGFRQSSALLGAFSLRPKAPTSAHNCLKTAHSRRILHSAALGSFWQHYPLQSRGWQRRPTD